MYESARLVLVEGPGLLVVGAAMLTCVLDQCVKTAAIRCFPGARHLPLSGDNWGVRLSVNPRPGLVALTDGQALALWIAAAVAAPLAITVAAPVGAAVAIGLGMAVGGAAGNLADRRLHGGVIDMIVLPRWPPFNLADTALVAGVLLIGSGLL